jgi:5-methylcytosine-specific restriction endonuclease McrA
MNLDQNPQPRRVPIPKEVRKAVFDREGGRCVECGSTFDLQYDHILPFALGGATTVENLQLLCSTCNQEKSDSL